VPGDPGSSFWTRTLADGTQQTIHADAFFPIEPTHTLAVVRGDALTLRFDPQSPPNSLDIRRGAAKDSPSADRQVLSAPVGDPSQFTADLPDGVSYLAVSASFAQGNSSYYFKLDVRPPPAVPGPRVVRQPNFTG